jgi:Zn-dependent protease with chaperone function
MDGFVYKGKTIIVSTRLTRLPEPQRVFILAHELAHYQLQHRAAMTSFFATVVAGQPDHSAALAAINGRAIELTQISHSAELEADAFAARVMQTLGYDPMEAARLFESIGEGRDNSTHPATGRRARAIRSLAFPSVP